jgi:hypothetical protein
MDKWLLEDRDEMVSARGRGAASAEAPLASSAPAEGAGD